jgi:hypothetical protein
MQAVQPLHSQGPPAHNQLRLAFEQPQLVLHQVQQEQELKQQVWLVQQV